MSEIILFEARPGKSRRPDSPELPSAEKLKEKLDGLTARKTALQTELRKIQREEKEYDIIKKNINMLRNKNELEKWKRN